MRVENLCSGVWKLLWWSHASLRQFMLVFPFICHQLVYMGCRLCQSYWLYVLDLKVYLTEFYIIPPNIYIMTAVRNN